MCLHWVFGWQKAGNKNEPDKHGGVSESVQIPVTSADKAKMIRSEEAGKLCPKCSLCTLFNKGVFAPESHPPISGISKQNTETES